MLFLLYHTYADGYTRTHALPGLGPAEGVGEEVVFVEGEGGVGGAELDEGGGGGLDGAAHLCIEDGGEFGDVDVGALAGGVKAVVGGLELDTVGAIGGETAVTKWASRTRLCGTLWSEALRETSPYLSGPSGSVVSWGKWRW